MYRHATPVFAAPLLLKILLLLLSVLIMSAAAAEAAAASPSATDSTSHVAPEVQLDPQTIEAYEALDKWKGCARSDAPVRLVYKHNRSRAAGAGFPTRLTVGSNLGLSDHETAAIFGWTTGDYRLLNPIARGSTVTEFDEYPFLPQDMAKVTCKLTREDVLPYIRVLSSALSKLPPLSSQQRLWRGHRRKLTPSSVGSIIRMKGFTSVTRDRDNALDFAKKSNEGRSNQRTLIGVLEHSSGRCISKLSARPGEMEVIFPADTTFEVVDPPGDTGSDDLKAVQSASERMRESMPGGDIDLIYVREVDLKARQKEKNQPLHIIRNDSVSTSSQPVSEWE
mmetsp:Transcript_29880/g.64709  ORF Transcript_29880/g.64709 Transcript_29880/m.64709 type:complete len:337 (+) Transcript_29880:352-1362(+)